MYTAVIILNFNNAIDTINCVRSIEQYNTSLIKYIIVDNGSTDKEGVKCIHQFLSEIDNDSLILTDTDIPVGTLPRFTFVICKDNCGYAQGNNKGLRLANADSSVNNILILNNDILFSEDILPTLLLMQQQQINCGIVTPLILSTKGDIDHCCARKTSTNWEIILLFLLFRRNLFHILSYAHRRQKILLNQPELIEQPFFPIDMPSGACMLIDKHLFHSIGGFDPNTFLYYEENILEKKLDAASRNNICVPSVKCTHLGAGSTQKLSSLFLQRCNLESADYYITQYGRLSFVQRLAWNVAKFLWSLFFKLSTSNRNT